jgi:hypothetical protein
VPLMSPAPTLRVRQVEVFKRPVKFRMTFRFGVAVVNFMPVAHLRLTAEFADGKVVRGHSACGLPPLWFDKDLSKSHDDNIRDQLRSTRIAIDAYTAAGAATAWELHRATQPAILKRCAADGLNELTSGYGIALVDLAVLDAVCRRAGRTFHEGLRADLFGLGPAFAACVPAAPVPRMHVRHTVGLSDPILDGDIDAPLDDGLPESLEQVVRETRGRYYKVKISKDAAASLERLRRIAGLLDRRAGDYAVSLDGNEQFGTMEEFFAFVRGVQEAPELRSFWHRILWIEQPVTRHHSLGPEVEGPLREIDKAKPVIIDESDGTDDAWARARALGYRGVSAKNCKGVFRTLHNFRQIHEANGGGPARYFMSSEDLTNQPIVSLHQDFAVAAALGISNSERNGHHYVRGLTQLSAREREGARRDYATLYRGDDGLTAMHIDGGTVSLEEINRAALGVVGEPDYEAMEPVR